MSSNENLVGVLIPNAKDELSKSSKLKQDIETQIQSIVEKEKKHLPDLKNLEASHAQSEQRLKSFDSLTQKMYEDYLNMLPKKLELPLNLIDAGTLKRGSINNTNAGKATRYYHFLTRPKSYRV